jgi:hypothetical protein
MSFNILDKIFEDIALERARVPKPIPTILPNSIDEDPQDNEYVPLDSLKLPPIVLSGAFCLIDIRKFEYENDPQLIVDLGRIIRFIEGKMVYSL